MNRVIRAITPQGMTIAELCIKPPYINDAKTLSQAFAQLAKQLEENGNPLVFITLTSAT